MDSSIAVPTLNPRTSFKMAECRAWWEPEVGGLGFADLGFVRGRICFLNDSEF